MSADAYARRQARARALGFTGDAQLRRYGGTAAARVNTRAAWQALPPEAQAIRGTALKVLADMRANRTSLERAAAAHGIGPEVVRFWVGDALLGRTSKARARSADRYYRPIRVLTQDGLGEVDVRGSRAAATLGRYWNAVGHYLETGDTVPLYAFEGVSVGGATLTTDIDVIEYVGNIGELTFESMYTGAA